MTFLDEKDKPEEKREESSVDYVSELVGENKRFKTLEEAVNALGKKAQHADSFIETLKKEKEEEFRVRQELETRVKTTEEILAAINDAPDIKPADDSPRDMSSSLTPEQIEKILEEKLAVRESEREKAERSKKSWELLAAELGGVDAAKKMVFEYAGKSESNKVVAETLGLYDPAALVQILKPNGPKKTSLIPDNGLRSRPNTSSSGLTWAEAKKLRREDPVKYNSLSFQRQLQNAVINDPDFYNK